jgi:hypothetical protein
MQHVVVSIKEPKLTSTALPVCKDGRVVALRVIVQRGAVTHTIEIDRHGTMTLLDHPSVEMLEAFTAFGAARPPCLDVYRFYERDPVEWLKLHRVFRYITPDGFSTFALRLADRALMHVARSHSLDHERVEELRELVAATRRYLAAGSEIPPVRGMTDEKLLLIRRANDYETFSFQNDDAIGQHIVETVTTAIDYALRVEAAASAPMPIMAIADYEFSVAPAPKSEERHWQAGQLIQVLDGGRLCRS